MGANSYTTVPKPEFDAEKLLRSLRQWQQHSLDPDSAMCCVLDESEASALHWIVEQYMRQGGPSGRIEALEEAALLCEQNNLLSGSIGALMDYGWKCCQQACADGIRGLMRRGATTEGK